MVVLHEFFTTIYILSTQLSPAPKVMSCYCPLLHPCISIYTLLPLLVIVALVLEFPAKEYKTKSKNLKLAPVHAFVQHFATKPVHLWHLSKPWVTCQRHNTRCQNVWSGWPVYEIKCLCSREQE